MNSPPLMAFLRNASNGTLYIIGTDVFLVSRRHNPLGAPRRIATLAAEALGLRERLSWTRDCRPPTLWQALDYGRNAAAITCTFERVIPFFRFLRTGREADAECSSLMRALLADLRVHAAPLLRSCLRPQARPLSASDLSRLFHAPSEIRDGLVVPLSPAPPQGAEEATAPVHGRVYTRQFDQAQPLEGVIMSIEHEARSKLAAHPGDGGALVLPAARLVQTVDRIVEYHGPTQHELYVEVYRDPGSRFTVQFSRGHSQLVCGPFHHYQASRAVYVGVEIRGGSRRDLLTSKLRLGSAADDFWQPSGLPILGGMCCGRPEQYGWIHSEGGSDIEAFLHWTMAGRWLGTGRCRRRLVRRLPPPRPPITFRPPPGTRRRAVPTSSGHDVGRRLQHDRWA